MAVPFSVEKKIQNFAEKSEKAKILVNRLCGESVGAYSRGSLTVEWKTIECQRDTVEDLRGRRRRADRFRGPITLKAQLRATGTGNWSR